MTKTQHAYDKYKAWPDWCTSFLGVEAWCLHMLYKMKNGEASYVPNELLKRIRTCRTYWLQAKSKVPDGCLVNQKQVAFRS